MTDLPSARSAREDLIEAIPQQILHMMQASSHLGPEPWLELDLTMKQLKVLMVLCSLGPTRPSVIANCIGASAANATGVLDRLEAQGYVERRPDAADRRALLVGLISGFLFDNRLYSFTEYGGGRLTRATKKALLPQIQASCSTRQRTANLAYRFGCRTVPSG